MPPLDFERTRPGKIELDEEQFLRYIEAEIALKESARAEVQNATAEVDRATQLVLETNAQRKQDIEQRKADMARMQELFAYLQDMHVNATTTWNELLRIREINQQTQGQLSSAQSQIGSAMGEIDYLTRRAKVPWPFGFLVKR